MDAWEPLACETHEYRNPAGETVRWLTLVGTVGRFMPPIGITSVPIPLAHGSRFIAAAHLERPVAFNVAAPASFTGRDELRRWAAVLDPAKGEGTVTVVQGDYAGRQLRCVYESGLDDFPEVSGSRANPATLIFRAAFPYWQDTSESSVDVAQGESETTWFPFLPLILGASDAFATFTIDNTGDIPAWPRVTVDGPGQEVTATNLTTGAHWTVTGDVPAGSTLIVDTRPGRKSVTVDGVNAFDRLTADSSLWPLVPGPNRVEISAAITSVESLISFVWRRNWLSA